MTNNSAPKHEFVVMSEDEWFDKFKPMLNHITGSVEGEYGFETYGEEYEYVRSIPQNRVWTQMDGDDDTIICSGLSFVNRINYFITEVPFEDNVDYEITRD